MLNGIFLFSGIEGIALGLKDHVRPVAYCECDPFCQALLMQHMRNRQLPCAPIWPDVRTLRGDMFPKGSVDIVCGGSPCQGISQAGRREGLEDERSSLFYEQIRIAREVQAAWIFWENVGGAKIKDLCEVARVFSESGYTARAGSLAAMEIGAYHRRRRIFILAHRSSIRMPRNGNEQISSTETIWKVAVKKTNGYPYKGNEGNWEARADKLLRDTYGVQAGVDRIRALGNAVVPLQAREAFMRLMGFTPAPAPASGKEGE